MGLNFYLKLLFFLLILVWIVGILIEFLIPQFEILTMLYPSLKIFYSHVCHQQFEKTISIDGHSLLVCSRCFGIYSGSLVSSFILIFFSLIRIHRIKYLILGTLPMIIDVILYSIGIYFYSKQIAFFSGFLFGMVGIVYIYNGMQILLEKPEKN